MTIQVGLKEEWDGSYTGEYNTEKVMLAWLSEEPTGADYAADGYTDLDAIKEWLSEFYDVTEEELEDMAEDLKGAVEALQEKEAQEAQGAQDERWVWIRI